MSVQALRVFLAILDRGSLSAAGREAGMSQPAVSNHLHALEERFGVCLLTRGRGVEATPAGACLAGHARRVVEGLDALDAAMAAHAAPAGRLRVGASTTPGEFLLPRVAAAFHERYPEVEFDLKIAGTEETVEALLDRGIEAAVIGCRADRPRLDERVVGGDELVPIVGVEDTLGGTVELEAVADRPLVLRERGSATRRTVERGLAAAGLGPRVSLELGSNAAVAGAVAAGAGIGFVPARVAEHQGRVRPFDIHGLDLRRSFVLLVERGRPLSPAAEAFVAVCTEKEAS